MAISVELKLLFLLPFAAGVAFLLWALWHLTREQRR